MTVISESFVLMKNLKEIDLDCKTENKIGNLLRDDGCKAIFYNAKYLSNLEELWLNSNKIK